MNFLGWKKRKERRKSILCSAEYFSALSFISFFLLRLRKKITDNINNTIIERNLWEKVK